MKKSLYSLYTKLDEKNYAIYNLLSGAFDILDSVEFSRFESGIPDDAQEKALWLDRGYFFESALDEKEYKDKRYLDFFQENSSTPTQFMLVLSYGCNFNCQYCYQRGVNTTNVMTREMIDAFVGFVVDYKTRENKDVIVSLFGGEPLLPGEKHRLLVEHLINSLNKVGVPLTVVTNGYNLEEYIPLLATADIREIHITIDGDQEHHDIRRKTKDGSGSFARIMAGIDASIKVGFPINVRLVVDRKNMDSLPSLAKVFDNRGYLDLPKDKFKVALGRNYELVNDYIKPEDLYQIDELHAVYVAMIAVYPILAKMHVPNFYGITNLADTGEMYVPSFDTCPAGKSEYVFDSSGQIYGCTASCGRDGYELGVFYPELSWNQTEVSVLQSRSIINIDQCRDCSVGVVCGGGCAVMAKEANGSLLSPNCKPIKEVMDIGIMYYKDKLLSMSEIKEEN